MIKIGFTGTRNGITEFQLETFHKLILQINSKKNEIEFHHGDCIGADQTIHQFLDTYVYTFINKIIIHPPSNSKLRACCELLNIKGKILEPQSYFNINKDIVNSTSLLIATPKTDDEIQYSGTWSTIRYAKKVNHKIIIIYPNGSKDIWPNPKLIPKRIRKKYTKKFK